MNTSGFWGTWACLGTLAMGCAQPPNDGACGKTMSIAHTKPTQKTGVTDPKPKLIGGFINIQNPGEALKRCAAHIEILELGQSPRALVWTARHCSSERFKEATSLSLELFVGNKYQEPIAIKDDFLERRKEAVELGKSQNLPTEAQKALQDAFDVYLGVQARQEDAGCSDEEWASATKEKGWHAVCANWWDLGVYEVRFAKPLMGGDLAAHLLTSKTELQAERNASMVRLTNAKVFQANPVQWRQNFIEAWQFQRLKTSASLIQWIEDNCDQRKPESKVPQSACSARQTLIDIADQYLKEGGSSIVQWADLNSHISAGKFRTPAGKPTLAELLKQEEGNRVIALQDAWRTYGRKFLFELKNIYVHTNVTESKAKDVSTGYLSFPIESLSATAGAVVLKFTTHGLEYSTPKDKVSIQFLPGDSGSVFSLDGVWPLLALSGVDGEQSSGGAALAALPARKAGSQDKSQNNAEDKNQRQNKETASTPCL